MPSKDPEVLRRAQRNYLLRHPEIVERRREQRRAKNQAASPEERQEQLRKKREWNAAHPDQVKKQKAAAYQRNKPAIAAKQQVKLANRTPEQRQADREYHQGYYLENKEELDAKNREWYESHKEEIQESNHQRTLQNLPQELARLRAWKKAHPENIPLQDARRRARKWNLPDTWTASQKAFMHEYWHHACAICGNPKSLLWTLAHDHWIPFDSPDCPGTIATNMLPLCHGNGGCNNSKGYSEPHSWLLRRFGAKKAAKIERAIHAYFAQVTLAFPEEAT